MSQIINATDATFETEVLQSDIPVLVDFWAPWCGPCKMISPSLVALAEEFDGRIKIVKIDVDDNFESAAKFQVRGIPALRIFKNGAQVAEKAGASTKSQLAAFIEANI